MSDEKTYAILLEIKQSIGSLQASTEAATRAFETHVQDDKAMSERLTNIEFSFQRQRGAAKVLMVVLSALGTLLGATADYLWTRHT